MPRASFRRSNRTRILRAILLIITAVFLIDLLSLASSRWHSLDTAPPPSPPPEHKIFISSIHWNNEAILRSHWNKAVHDLAQHLGVGNVYVSVHESGSWDDSKGALRELDFSLEQLKVNRTVSLDETTHIDELHKAPTAGWIQTSRGRKELRRIPYLSRLRNQSLQPLWDLAEQGLKFDKVLFLNDVVFTTDDILRLLSTQDGEYAAACSIDYATPSHYYDTFALRDDRGNEAATSSWPYFRSSTSRNALVAGRPVPVSSCWNGVVAFDAEPFYDPDPLKFRGVADELAEFHLEGSECCLIHADNPLSRSKGIWLNPAVRVAYNAEAYEAVHPDGGGQTWPGLLHSVYGVWWTRFVSWIPTGYFKERVADRRVKKWMAGDAGRNEPGRQCLINEMQVLAENGWAHV